MSTSIVLNDNTPTPAPTNGCCASITDQGSPAKISMSINGTAGTGTTNAGSLSTGVSRTTLYYIGVPGEYDGKQVASGTWTVTLHIGNSTITATLDSIYICQANSSGTSLGTIGSSTGIGQSLIKNTSYSFNVTGSAATFGTNEIPIISFQITVSSGLAVTIANTQTITSPTISTPPTQPVPPPDQRIDPLSNFNAHWYEWFLPQKKLPPTASTLPIQAPYQRFDPLTEWPLPPNFNPNWYEWFLPQKKLPPTASTLPIQAPYQRFDPLPDWTLTWQEWFLPRKLTWPSTILPPFPPLVIRNDFEEPGGIFRSVPPPYLAPVPGPVPPSHIIRSDFEQEGLVFKSRLPMMPPVPMHPLQSLILRSDFEEPARFFRVPLLAPPVPGGVPPARIIRFDHVQEAVLWIGKPMPVINPIPVAGGVIPAVIVSYPEGFPFGSSDRPFAGSSWKPTPLPVAPSARQGTLILFLRGPKGTLPVLQQSEPAYTTDSKQMFIGDTGTNICIGGIAAAAPAHTSSSGYPGEYFIDGSGNLYFCYALNSWVKFTGGSTAF